jgi:hypothetical protein
MCVLDRFKKVTLPKFWLKTKLRPFKNPLPTIKILSFTTLIVCQKTPWNGDSHYEAQENATNFFEIVFSKTKTPRMYTGVTLDGALLGVARW